MNPPAPNTSLESLNDLTQEQADFKNSKSLVFRTDAAELKEYEKNETLYDHLLEAVEDLRQIMKNPKATIKEKIDCGKIIGELVKAHSLMQINTKDLKGAEPADDIPTTPKVLPPPPPAHFHIKQAVINTGAMAPKPK